MERIKCNTETTPQNLEIVIVWYISSLFFFLGGEGGNMSRKGSKKSLEPLKRKTKIQQQQPGAFHIVYVGSFLFVFILCCLCRSGREKKGYGYYYNGKWKMVNYAGATGNVVNVNFFVLY